MCSRFLLTSPIEAIRQLFRFAERPNLAPRYNIPPTSQILAVRKKTKQDDQAEEYEAFLPVWGLIPPFSKDRNAAARMINARSETVREKPSFRSAYARQRCLIPVDGFYEWKQMEDGSKQPYFFQAEDHQPLAFAGIWEVWQSPDEGLITSCSMLTQPAPDYIKSIHHRAPVIISPDQFDLWTDEAVADPLPQIRLTDTRMTSHPVSKKVGNVRADGADLIAPIKIGTPPRQGSLF